MKKTPWINVCLVMVLLMVMLPLSAAAKEETASLAGLNCARDAGKLVVYTDEYGESTGTNRWGAEAIVGSDHKVTGIVGGNATIPEGGFVVSGHDNEEEGGALMKTWIYENIEVGDYVYVNRRTLTLTVTDKPLDEEATSPFFSFDNPVDGVNVSRGNNQMILYTPEYGETTGTNEYGYEIVVENDVITKLGGNNSAIPADGYVISLHGSTANWMRVKLLKGMMVEIEEDTMNVIFSYNAEGLKRSVDYAVKGAQTAIDNAKALFVYADYEAAQSAVDDLSKTYTQVLADYENGGSDLEFADGCDAIVTQAEVVCNALCDSYPVQYRGVWIRPSQQSPAEVEEYIKELHDACVNFVCVEGWFENGVIMNVPEDSLFGRHPSFDYDVLQAYIDACHKYGMECHLWMPIMCVGSEIHDGYEENTVPGQRSEWLSLNNHGHPYHKEGFMMLDPANDEAREYMMEFYRYLVTTYDIDCFEMDYIRYYARTDEEDYGYTEAAFAGFEEAYGYGVEPKYDPRGEYWEDWCQYRRDCVTTWVRELRALLDEAAPDMLLAADVAFPFEHALDKVYQEFPLWLEEGLVDILHPMAYGDGYGEEITKAVELAGDTCMVVTGLGAQTDILGAIELERQAREDNMYGAYGDCYFEAQTYLADQVPSAVKQTVYRTEAMTPFLDTDASLNAMLDYMVGRIDEVVLPQEGMTDAEAAAVKEAVTAAKAGVADGRISAQALAALREAIGGVKNAAAKDALQSDLERTEKIVCVGYHLTREQLTDEQAYVTASEGASSFSWWYLIPIAAAVLIAAAAVTVAVSRKKKKD